MNKMLQIEKNASIYQRCAAQSSQHMTILSKLALPLCKEFIHSLVLICINVAEGKVAARIKSIRYFFTAKSNNLRLDFSNQSHCTAKSDCSL